MKIHQPYFNQFKNQHHPFQEIQDELLNDDLNEIVIPEIPEPPQTKKTGIGKGKRIKEDGSGYISNDENDKNLFKILKEKTRSRKRPARQPRIETPPTINIPTPQIEERPQITQFEEEIFEQAPPPIKKEKKERRGWPRKIETLANTDVPIAIEKTNNYHTQKLIINNCRTEIFTKLNEDIFCESVEEYNYFLYLHDRRVKYIDKIKALSSKIDQVDSTL